MVGQPAQQHKSTNNTTQHIYTTTYKNYPGFTADSHLFSKIVPKFFTPKYLNTLQNSTKHNAFPQTRQSFKWSKFIFNALHFTVQFSSANQMIYLQHPISRQMTWCARTPHGCIIVEWFKCRTIVAMHAANPTKGLKPPVR